MSYSSHISKALFLHSDYPSRSNNMPKLLLYRIAIEYTLLALNVSTSLYISLPLQRNDLDCQIKDKVRKKKKQLST